MARIVEFGRLWEFLWHISRKCFTKTFLHTSFTSRAPWRPLSAINFKVNTFYVHLSNQNYNSAETRCVLILHMPPNDDTLPNIQTQHEHEYMQSTTILCESKAISPTVRHKKWFYVHLLTSNLINFLKQT